MKTIIAILALTIAATVTAAFADNIVFEDYRSGGVFSKNCVNSTSSKENSINRHPGYITVKWEEGWVACTSIGTEKVPLPLSGSVSFDYRTTKKGKNFDPDRTVSILLCAFEGVKKEGRFRYATENLTDDGDWHRVCIPLSAIFKEGVLKAKDVVQVYSVQIGVEATSGIKDKVDIDIRNVIAHTASVEDVQQIPVDQ